MLSTAEKDMTKKEPRSLPCVSNLAARGCMQASTREQSRHKAKHAPAKACMSREHHMQRRHSHDGTVILPCILSEGVWLQAYRTCLPPLPTLFSDWKEHQQWLAPYNKVWMCFNMLFTLEDSFTSKLRALVAGTPHTSHLQSTASLPGSPPTQAPSTPACCSRAAELH